MTELASAHRPNSTAPRRSRMNGVSRNPERSQRDLPIQLLITLRSTRLPITAPFVIGVARWSSAVPHLLLPQLDDDSFAQLVPSRRTAVIGCEVNVFRPGVEDPEQ